MSDISATNEHRIVAKAVTGRDIQPLLQRGVDGTWFIDSEHREALDFVLRHHDKYGVTPDEITFRKQMGNQYALFRVRESFEALIDDQAESCQWRVGNQMLPDVEDALRAGAVDKAIDLTRKYLAQMESYQPVPTSTVNRMEEAMMDDHTDEYEERASHPGGVVGYETGFPTIDAATHGLQPGQLVTVLAQPKVGKTSLCLDIADYIYVHYEATVLFLSLEMTIREMEWRQTSLMAGISFSDFQKGTLSPDDYKKFKDWIAKAKSDYGWPFYFTDASAGSTVSAISASIARYEPALVVIDGIYMLEDEISGEVNTAKSLTNITRSLKRLAVRADVPILINTQALGWKSKGTKINLDSAGYSSSFAQDSDVVLGLERIQPGKGESEATYQTQRLLKVLASRSGSLAQTEIRFDYGAGVIEELV